MNAISTLVDLSAREFNLPLTGIWITLVLQLAVNIWRKSGHR